MLTTAAGAALASLCATARTRAQPGGLILLGFGFFDTKARRRNGEQRKTAEMTRQQSMRIGKQTVRKRETRGETRSEQTVRTRETNRAQNKKRRETTA